MRFGALALLAILVLGSTAGAHAAEWRSEQPLGEGGYAANIGEVGDIECWQGEANRCLLIAAGNGGVAAGVYAYDGSGWYRYSTVCGGHEGRIVWAGPSEFWTVSDQQRGQVVENVGESRFFAISLCHFKNGRVVASYGEPIGSAGAYMHMNAAACSGPSDCWFAGERLPGSVNQGAFHLHWNGSTLTAIPSLTDQAEVLDPGRTVTGLAFHQGKLYETVGVAEGDVPTQAEKEKQAEFGPSLLHLVEPGAEHPFQPLYGASAFDFGGAGAEATVLEGFRFSDEGQRLWAVAGATESPGAVTVLRLEEEELKQLPLVDPEAVLEEGDRVNGLAAEPGQDRAWIGFRRQGDFRKVSTPARLTRIDGDGTVGAEVTLPAPDEGIERSGPVGAITCAAPGQCWMATEFGWLFHLGPTPTPNTDSALHGPVITVRPRDNSLPVVPPVGLPEDDSGAEAKGKTSEQEELPPEFEEPLPQRRPALVSKIDQHLVHGTILELTFTLRAKAHVQLLARREGRVVAKTKRYTLSRGRHSLRLPLDPKRWPTKLDLRAHRAGAAE